MKRDVRKQSRFTVDPNVKVLLKQIGIGVGLFSILGLTLSGVWYVTRLPSLTIDTVTASGGETISADEVRIKAEAALAGTYGRLIPKRFFPFYPQRGILESVQEVDRIKDVVVERVSTNEVRITYGEYTPFALWCAEGPSDACLFLDERGYAFAPAPQLTGGSFVRYRSAVMAPEIGKSIIPFEQYWNTVTFTKLLAVDGLFVRSVEVDAAGDVFYELVGGGELRATLAQEPQALFDNLRTILSSQQFAHLKSDKFSYIDLRFGNKVYINENLESSLATSTPTTTDAVAGEDVTIKSVIADAHNTEAEESEVRPSEDGEIEQAGGEVAPVTIQFTN